RRAGVRAGHHSGPDRDDHAHGARHRRSARDGWIAKEPGRSHHARRADQRVGVKRRDYSPAVPRSKTKMNANQLITLWAMVLGTLLTGCGKNNQTQSAKAPPQASSGERTALEQSISVWTSGDKGGAVSQFLQIDWTKGKPFSSGSVLHYTEAE